MNEISNSPKNHKTIAESAAGENEEIGKLNLPVNDRDHQMVKIHIHLLAGSNQHMLFKYFLQRSAID